MACNFSPNQTVAIYQNQTFTYSQFTTSIAVNATCGGTTYIRPNVGGALLPWFYAVVLLLVHLPTVIIRATRWEKVQVLSVALAAFAVACVIQSFVSTKLKPEGVLVWMPLMLPLDAGAMMQLMVLIVEEESLKGLWDAILGRDHSTIDGSVINMENMRSTSHLYAPVLDPKDVTTSYLRERIPSPAPGNPKYHSRTPAEIKNKAWIAIGAFLLLLMIIALEITAAVYATQGHKAIPEKTVLWCSPIFQPFAMVVQSGCEFLPTSQDSTKGIGCVGLPAKTQGQWLQAISILIPVALILQGIDFAVLMMVHGKRRWKAVKMQRPWFTMFFGIIILVLLITVGFLNSTNLPAGINADVWIYNNMLGGQELSVCRGSLHPGGLRGSILGWTDGMLQGWGTTYLGG